MQLSHDITINMTRVISIRLFCFCQRRQGCLDIINEFLSIDSFKISTIFIPFFQFCQMAVVLFKGIGMQCLPFVHCSRFFSIRNPSLEISEIRDDAVHFRDIELTRNEIFDSFCFFENSLNVGKRLISRNIIGIDQFLIGCVIQSLRSCIFTGKERLRSTLHSCIHCIQYLVNLAFVCPYVGLILFIRVEQHLVCILSLAKGSKSFVLDVVDFLKVVLDTCIRCFYRTLNDIKQCRSLYLANLSYHIHSFDVAITHILDGTVKAIVTGLVISFHSIHVALLTTCADRNHLHFDGLQYAMYGSILFIGFTLLKSCGNILRNLIFKFALLCL